MADITLAFQGPFTFVGGESSIFHSPVADSTGIYLWTIRQREDDMHLIHYIGETTSFARRNREYLTQILGMNYGIFSPEKAREGVSEILWPGAWRDKTQDGPAIQIEAYETVRDDVMSYLAFLNVFFAELEDGIDSRLRKHIEGCIGWNLRNHHPEAKALYPDGCHIGTMADKNHGTLRVSTPEEIRGLDLLIPY